MFILRSQVGGVLQFTLVIQVIVISPEIPYPTSQLYVTVPPAIVLVGTLGDPLTTGGGGPQETIWKNQTIHT